MAFNLSLTKKSDDQTAAAPDWHPNFRNFERLPDTKVVRTTFFVNTAAIGITLSLLLWLGFREYHLHDLHEQIAGAQKVIDSNMRQSREAIRLTKIFSDEEKKLDEAGAFLRSTITPAEFVSILGQSLPKEVAIESVNTHMAEGNIPAAYSLRGLVAGTPDQASGAVSNYVDMLRAHPRLGAIFDPISLTNLNRDARSSLLSFELSFKVKAEGKEKK